MARFKYRGLQNGTEVSGVVVAGDIGAARAQLRTKKVQIATLRRDWLGEVFSRESKVGTADLIAFTRQFAAMVQAGLPLTRTLNILLSQSSSKTLRRVINEISTAVQTGETLASAMARHPAVFDEMYINLVVAGEQSGKLPDTLHELAIFHERQREIGRRVQGALIYPVLVVLLTIVSLTIMYLVVLPVFEETFRGLPDLPWLTKVNLDISARLRADPWPVLLSMVAGLFAMRYAFKNPITRTLLDRFGLRMPVFGKIVQYTAVVRIARTLEMLLDSGVNVMDAMSMTASTASNSVIRKAITDARQSVSAGSDLARPLRRSGVFPEMMTAMIATGEETGKLEVLLRDVANFYERELTYAVDAALEMIKPAAVVLLGGTVGVVLASIYLPIFSAIVAMADGG